MSRITVVMAASLLLSAVPPGARAVKPPAVYRPGATERESFTLQAQSDMLDWDARIHDFAVASGRHVDSQAENDLNIAWRRVGGIARQRRERVGNGEVRL